MKEQEGIRLALYSRSLRSSEGPCSCYQTDWRRVSWAVRYTLRCWRHSRWWRDSSLLSARRHRQRPWV